MESDATHTCSGSGLARDGDFKVTRAFAHCRDASGRTATRSCSSGALLFWFVERARHERRAGQIMCGAQVATPTCCATRFERGVARMACIRLLCAIALRSVAPPRPTTTPSARPDEPRRERDDLALRAEPGVTAAAADTASSLTANMRVLSRLPDGTSSSPESPSTCVHCALWVSCLGYTHGAGSVCSSMNARYRIKQSCHGRVSV